VLQGRLTPALAVIGAALLASCGGGDGGVIEQNVIRPGITAIDQAGDLQCSQDASALRTAIDAYEMLEGQPPINEQVLIDGQYLREPSDVWDVVDGELVATDPGCGGADTDIPETEIVTSTEPPPSPEDVLVGFSAEQISAVGGLDCARELAEIFSAGERFIAASGAEPQDFQDFIDAGVLDELPKLWTTNGDALVPVEGSGCVAPD
jgi:hypothetical protein